MNKMNMADKIALWSFIVAIIAIIIGVTTPEVRCFLRLQSESCPSTGSGENSNGSTTGSQPSTNDSNNVSHPSSNNPSLDWGNIHDYFKTEKTAFEKGFQKAPSQLSFIVEAQGNFEGKMYAYLYDKDGIKVCPFPDIIPDCSLLRYEHSVSFQTKGRFSTDSYYWQTKERDKAVLFIPDNVSRVELNFAQSRY
jgi:hypothetical protein